MSLFVGSSLYLVCNLEVVVITGLRSIELVQDHKLAVTNTYNPIKYIVNLSTPTLFSHGGGGESIW